MIGIIHKQATYFYCCKCKKRVKVCEVEIPDGAIFHKVHPGSFGWTRFFVDGKSFLFCPLHKITEVVTVDGEILYEK